MRTAPEIGVDVDHHPCLLHQPDGVMESANAAIVDVGKARQVIVITGANDRQRQAHLGRRLEESMPPQGAHPFMDLVGQQAHLPDGRIGEIGIKPHPLQGGIQRVQRRHEFLRGRIVRSLGKGALDIGGKILPGRIDRAIIGATEKDGDRPLCRERGSRIGQSEGFAGSRMRIESHMGEAVGAVKFQDRVHMAGIDRQDRGLAVGILERFAQRQRIIDILDHYRRADDLA